MNENSDGDITLVKAVTTSQVAPTKPDQWSAFRRRLPLGIYWASPTGMAFMMQQDFGTSLKQVPTSLTHPRDDGKGPNIHCWASER